LVLIIPEPNASQSEFSASSVARPRKAERAVTGYVPKIQIRFR